jgi:hypothetical protein
MDGSRPREASSSIAGWVVRDTATGVAETPEITSIAAGVIVQFVAG